MLQAVSTLVMGRHVSLLKSRNIAPNPRRLGARAREGTALGFLPLRHYC